MLVRVEKDTIPVQTSPEYLIYLGGLWSNLISNHISLFSITKKWNCFESLDTGSNASNQLTLVQTQSAWGRYCTRAWGIKCIYYSVYLRITNTPRLKVSTSLTCVPSLATRMVLSGVEDGWERTSYMYMLLQMRVEIHNSPFLCQLWPFVLFKLFKEMRNLGFVLSWLTKPKKHIYLTLPKPIQNQIKPCWPQVASPT